MIERSKLKLVTSKKLDLNTIVRWFPTAESAILWGGPSMRFPLTVETLKEDICWGQMRAYSLRGTDDELIGCGQVRLREGRLHLSRLAVAPKRRCQGLGKQLVAEILKAETASGVSAFSLFVFDDNRIARACYERLGFFAAPAQCHESEGQNCTFMLLDAVLQ